MKLYEYQAKELFAKYGVPIPKGGLAMTPEEACSVADKLGLFISRPPFFYSPDLQASNIHSLLIFSFWMRPHKERFMCLSADLSDTVFFTSQ